MTFPAHRLNLIFNITSVIDSRPPSSGTPASNDTAPAGSSPSMHGHLSDPTLSTELMDGEAS